LARDFWGKEERSSEGGRVGEGGKKNASNREPKKKRLTVLEKGGGRRARESQLAAAAGHDRDFIFPTTPDQKGNRCSREKKKCSVSKAGNTGPYRLLGIQKMICHGRDGSQNTFVAAKRGRGGFQGESTDCRRGGGEPPQKGKGKRGGMQTKRIHERIGILWKNKKQMSTWATPYLTCSSLGCEKRLGERQNSGKKKKRIKKNRGGKSGVAYPNETGGRETRHKKMQKKKPAVSMRGGRRRSKGGV